MIIKLSTGKEFYANKGIIGIVPVGSGTEEFILTYGYDGIINLIEFDTRRPIYTWSELLEIADIAIMRWRTFKQQVALGIIPVIGYIENDLKISDLKAKEDDE